MALSIVTIPGDGVTDTFNVSFALGILDRNSVTAWVTGEVDGGGNKVYRTITYLTDTMLKISGPKAGVGVNVVFTRTVSNNSLIVNYEDGDIMNETNLNTSQKQSLMLVHQVLDGRFSAFIQDVSAGGFRITNLGTPINAGDAANKTYVDSVVATGAANAASAAASAAAALASQNAAAASQGSAATSASTATTQAGIATTQATTATTQAGLATTAKTAAEAARDKAQEWSDKPEDVFVTGTTEYSAYHWSRKALSYVLGSIATSVHGATAKTPVDADEGMLADSAASFGLKKFTFAQLATWLFSRASTLSSTWTISATAGNGKLVPSPRLSATFTTMSQITGGIYGGIEVQATDNGAGLGPAVIALHRPGAYAGYIGLDTDNILKWGGWSVGATAYKILHEGLASATPTGTYNFTGTLQQAGSQVATVANRATTMGTIVGRALTISTSAPSGGATGDLWFQV